MPTNIEQDFGLIQREFDHRLERSRLHITDFEAKGLAVEGHATAAMTLDRYGHLLTDDLSGVATAPGNAIDSTAESLRRLGWQDEEQVALNAL